MSTKFGKGFSSFGSSTPQSADGLATNEVTLSYFTGIPDPSIIADPKLVVVFKSLLKKDSTTKERALNEFTSLLTESDSIADDAHWAWAQMYPKLSIDTSRSVRILAHKVQGRLGTLLGKRFAKYLKYDVGAWIFGLFDTDRMVSVATQQSLAQVFPEKEKRDSLYVVFLDVLLDFVYDVIANESVATLSDERFISKEEADAKYYRTLKCACATFAYLITNTPMAKLETKKTEEKILLILQQDILWKSAYSADVALSRTVLNLISTLFSSAPKEWSEAIKDRAAIALISKGLSSSSGFVSVDLLQALINLTRYDSECWNSVKSKKPPFTRLTTYIKNGNKGRADHFWASILALLSLLPSSISPYAYGTDNPTIEKNGQAITESFLEALLRETGPKAYHTWGYYMALVEKITIASKGQNTACISALYNALQVTFFSDDSKVLENDTLFKIIGKKTADILKVTPAPVQESITSIRETINPQKPTTAALNFLYFMRCTIENADQENLEGLKSSVSSLISEAIISLKEDPLDTSLATFALDSLSVLGKDLLSYPTVHDSYAAFIDLFFTSYVTLGIRETLLNISKSFIEISRDVSSFHSSLQVAQDSLMLLDEYSSESTILLSNFLSLYLSLSGALSPSQSFSHFVGEYISNAFKNIDSLDVQKLLENAVLSHDAIVLASISSNVVNLLAQNVLKEDGNHQIALNVLLSVYKKDEKFLNNYFQTTEGKSTVSQLWKASERHELKSEIDVLLSQIEAFAVSGESLGNSGISTLAKDITDELKTGSLEEVSLLVQRAQRLIESASSQDAKEKVFEQLLLTETAWNDQIQYSFNQGLSSVLSISPAFGNSVYLTSFDTSVRESSQLLTSAALINMAVFTTSLIHMFPDLYESITSETSALILTSLAYTSELIDIASAQSPDLHTTGGQHVDLLDVFSALTADIRDILSQALTPLIGNPEKYLGGLLDSSVESIPIFSVLSSAWAACQNADPKAFYSSRVLETIFSLVITSHDHSSLELFKKLLNRFERNSLGCYALLNSLKHSQIIDGLTTLRNNLLGALVTLPKSQLSTKGLKYFTLFISSMALQESSKSGLTFFKLMNFSRTLDGILQSDEVYDESYAPLITLTAQLYELVSDHFLEELSLSFWEQFTHVFEVGVVITSLGSPFSSALMFSILKLFQKLVTLNSSNMGGEDLSSVLEKTSTKVYDLLLENLGEVEPASNQLEAIKTEALLQVLSNVPSNTELDVDNLYRLLSFDDKSLQILGLVLLKTHVTATQKDKSFTYSLLKQPIDPQETDIESYLLPFELLSLVLESPVDKSESQKRQFLYAWFAIFLFFEHSVTSLRQFYLSQLREGDYVNSLLSYISLEIESGLEKDTDTHWSIESLDPIVDLPNSHDIDRCLLNIYYQALNHAGSLAKMWFLDLKKKKIRMDIENFTKTHISPLVIRNKAQTIRRALDQDNDLVDDTLNVQISKSGKVVTVYYYIDNQTMEVAFIYPDSYPLKDIQLEGVQLVGAREKQWRAWILASQSALKFNGGSLLDSLDLFKRNVAMHFDGVAACAICYSILHEDHSLPTKECGTCHNRFHTDCLYRWFKSGSTESCPLCRSELSFRIGH